MQRFFRIPAIETNAEALQQLFLMLANNALRNIAYLSRGISFRQIEKPTAVLLYHFIDELLDVFLRIAFARIFDLLTELAFVASQSTDPELSDLSAGVVDIKLLLHSITGKIKQVGKATAENRIASVPDMQAASRIC